MYDQEVVLTTWFMAAVIFLSRDIWVCGMGWWKRNKFTSLFLLSLGATGFGVFTLIVNHLVQYGGIIL
ncbi:hypothetical protein VPHK356_0098 [Vibrio phage K356]|nr:hypothetical protein MYOV002v2_p0090 [Vibrio phage 144E46.1]